MIFSSPNLLRIESVWRKELEVTLRYIMSAILQICIIWSSNPIIKLLCYCVTLWMCFINHLEYLHICSLSFSLTCSSNVYIRESSDLLAQLLSFSLSHMFHCSSNVCLTNYLTVNLSLSTTGLGQSVLKWGILCGSLTYFLWQKG